MSLRILITIILYLTDLTSYGYASSSGFYIDNGQGQTVRETTITPQDRQEIEHEILDLLGLPDRPNKEHIHPSLRKSAPQFLLNIYLKFSEEVNEERRSRRIARNALYSNSDLFTEADQRAIEESDWIMTFLNKGHVNMPKVRHHRYGERLVFDTSEAAANGTLLLYASLKIYKNFTGDHANAITNGRLITIRTSLIKSYDTDRKFHELDFLAEHIVQYSYRGWIEINATNMMDRWMAESMKNKGIFVEVFFSENPQKQVRPQDVGLILSNKFGRYQPFLVSYYKGRDLVKPTPHVTRSKRSVGAANQRKKPYKKSVRPRNPLLEKWALKEKSCQIHTLYVSFRELNWQDWIIAPDGFGAFFCHGECNFPLKSHMNATNHALIQTLVHLMHPGSVPKPCCAPTKLTPISVLYHIDDANINLKKYKNMVVKSCGCL
ncbi:protein 60A [Aedes albopictus]|uniref:TGF-beta family profile domain-containing protein n=1 Tax=Aedes albopictus TaxID=7160 RepID=A0ABM1YHV4_AEDAL